MTIPRFWTDPLSGADYSFGDKLPAADINELKNGLLAIDYAIENFQAKTYLYGSLQLSSALYSRVVVDEAYDRVLILTQLTGSTSIVAYDLNINGEASGASRSVVGEPAGGWTTTAGNCAMAQDGAGTVVIGATTVNASATKVAVSTGGGNFATYDTNAAGAGQGISEMIWDANYSRFYAGFNFTGTNIEYSDDGTSWTQASMASAVAISGLASNGSGTIVALLNTTTNQALRSTNGTSFSTVVMPSSAVWNSVTYSAGFGKWFATNSAGGMAYSSDGSTWSALSPTTLPGSGFALANLGSTGNLVIAQNATNGDIYVSER